MCYRYRQLVPERPATQQSRPLVRRDLEAGQPFQEHVGSIPFV